MIQTRRYKSLNIFLSATFVLLVLVTGASQVDAMTIFLRAEQFTKTMPDATQIEMWGFAQDSAFGALDGEVTSPGPRITVPDNDSSLTIQLDNNLTVPISIVIPGQMTIMTPVLENGRLKSFTHETQPGNTTAVAYTWNTMKPGTFLYQSGTHQAVQIQMGLYGAVTHNAQNMNVYNEPQSIYDNEALLLFSEIDPQLHEAVAQGTYGEPGQGITMTSTKDYRPTYFLINGMPFPDTEPLIMSPLVSGQAVFIRMLNAGLKTHNPTFLGLNLNVIAEDGNFSLNNIRETSTVNLPAGKTRDAVVQLTTTGQFPVYDRSLHLTNDKTSGGGMLTYLDVGTP